MDTRTHARTQACTHILNNINLILQIYGTSHWEAADHRKLQRLVSCSHLTLGLTINCKTQDLSRAAGQAAATTSTYTRLDGFTPLWAAGK